jgi:hypothetical protein
MATPASLDATRQHKNPPEEVENRRRYDPMTVALITAGVIAVTAMVAIIAVELFYFAKECVAEWRDCRTVDELKNRVKSHLPGLLATHLIDLVDKIQEISPKTLLRRMELTHDDEKKFLLYVIENYEVSAEELKEILNGAHVRLEDGGTAYNKWVVELNLKNERISSHPSNDKQYGLQGHFIRELLFSKMDNSSWFQLECNPTSIGHVLRHGWNYCCYRFRNMNQGPYGESHFKDCNPKVLIKRKA